MLQVQERGGVTGTGTVTVRKKWYRIMRFAMDMAEPELVADQVVVQPQMN